MNKQKVVYPHNGILLGNKREWSTDTCYNMNEPWQHYAMWKKPITKDHILYNSIYMKCPEQTNLLRQKVDWGEVGRDGEWRVTGNRQGWKCSQIDCDNGCTTLCIY